MLWKTTSSVGQNRFWHIDTLNNSKCYWPSTYTIILKLVNGWIFYILGYLPPEEVSDEFCDLMSIALSTNSGTTFIFTDYILENYITADSNFNATKRIYELINNLKTTNGANHFIDNIADSFTLLINIFIK